jgi:transcriptional regulator with XRE-family HTH domain
MREMSIDNKEVGIRIRNIRQSNGLSQSSFGEKVGNAHKSLVSKWERGENLPNNERINTIAELGNISVNELLHGDPVDNKIEVGKRIKQIRLSKGDTLESFGIRIAKVLNTSSDEAPSKSNVLKWETGFALPNKLRLKAIADIANITVEELLGTDISEIDNIISSNDLDEIKKILNETYKQIDEASEMIKEGQERINKLNINLLKIEKIIDIE